MKRIVVGLAIVVLVFGHGVVRLAAQDQPKKQPVEVRLVDRSVVNMTMPQEEIELVTKYGKLSIPVREIRRVEFGFHTEPDTQKAVDSAIKQLSSNLYKTREAASKDLLDLGRFAYPALRQAGESKDRELSTRASGLAKQIEDCVAADLLAMKPYDTVHTAEFTVTGTIRQQTIKAHSPHFGEVSLKLSELRQLQVRVCKQEVNLDAAKHGSSLDQWCDTGISVDAGQRLVLTGEGQVDLWPQGPGQFIAAPKGYNAVGKGGQFMAGALIGKLGENGKAFYIGDRYEGDAGEEGKLFLRIEPSPWNTASAGSYTVKISTGDR
jgi:hypothetical protein